mmetsp:Transcript_203/g.366  ORF Transcript_203/g.366 Transcript_203/m.366 type:complete len:134 (-) Transcript_203:51-452(-)|eukprot:CAMPEP_0184297704 /NCGR_PEP_ID=MMETSP1049-20130417/8594_1 /TAXON_ID=77928 /ORGANISM="Proteomonas sulcata, Strain CCMP704" /LENGTH=133 /DNA_ID=CAMNT_0026607545 /DNA_START=196 /DNA_END=597 /DNA_ORIENTATION=-
MKVQAVDAQSGCSKRGLLWASKTLGDDFTAGCNGSGLMEADFGSPEVGDIRTPVPERLRSRVVALNSARTPDGGRKEAERALDLDFSANSEALAAASFASVSSPSRVLNIDCSFRVTFQLSIVSALRGTPSFL